MKRLKKLVPIVLSLVLVLGILSGAANPSTTTGMSFTATEKYVAVKNLETAPRTFEATVSFPTSLGTDRGGVIIGNYKSEKACVNLEVYNSGAPRLYYKIENNGTAYDFKFDDVNLYTGVNTHLAITVEDEYVNCYINGELKQSLSRGGAPLPNTAGGTLVLGGDLRDGNDRYCRGSVVDVALFSDVRTADEIETDVTNYGADGLILRLATPNATPLPNTITDLSGNGYNFTVPDSPWIDVADHTPYTYDYSFVIVGDTQLVNYNNPDNMAKIYDWIVANKETRKIKYVMGLGDITDKNLSDEWTRARDNLAKLDTAGIPYSLTRGNHDIDRDAGGYTQGYGESDYYFHNAFKDTPYATYVDGTYNNKLDNTYKIFTIGRHKFLLFALDYGPSDAVLTWAGNIISQNTDCNVIITTHAYLASDGTTLDSVNDSGTALPSLRWGYNDGDDIWEKLVKKHENIKLVLCGHTPSADVLLTRTAGENGNMVSQLLIDPQGLDKDYTSAGGTGMVSILGISADGTTATIETYSTVRNQYHKESNQFTFDLNLTLTATAETEKVVAFKAAYEAAKSATTLESVYSAIVNAVKLYNGLSSVEKQAVTQEYAVLTAMVTAYNGMVEDIMAERANAVGLAGFTSGK